MRLSILVILLSTIFLFSFDAADGIQFENGTFNTALYKAKTDKKLVFVDFYADWCSPCKIMAQTTFKDPEIAGYLHKNYVSYKVNIEDFDGIPIKSKYNIKVLPTLLILDETGKEVARYEEGMGSSKLYKVLNQHNTKKTGKPIININPKKYNPAALRKASSGLYKFDVNEVENGGYGIQIGTFGEYGNVLKEVKKLSKKFDQDVLVNIHELQGKPVYRIIIGNFPQRNAAADYKIFMSKKGIEGYVVDLANL